MENECCYTRGCEQRWKKQQRSEGKAERSLFPDNSRCPKTRLKHRLLLFSSFAMKKGVDSRSSALPSRTCFHLLIGPSPGTGSPTPILSIQQPSILNSHPSIPIFSLFQHSLFHFLYTLYNPSRQLHSI